MFISLSFCLSQNLRDEIERQKQQEQQEQQAAEQRKQREREAAERQRQEAEKQRQQEEERQKVAQEQKQQELNQRYQNAIKSAESNFSQKNYEQAKQDYLKALELKPENAVSINPKIAEIEKKMNEPATLYIYRPSPGGLNLSILPKRYEVLLDNVVVGNTTNKWKTTTTVKTFGNKTLSAAIDGRKAQVQVKFEPGEIYYVRCGISSKTIKTGKYRTTTDKNGKTTRTEITETEYTPTLQLVDKSVGKPEFDAIVNK